MQPCALPQAQNPAVTFELCAVDDCPALQCIEVPLQGLLALYEEMRWDVLAVFWQLCWKLPKAAYTSELLWEETQCLFSKDCCGVYQGMRQHVYWWVFIRKKGTLLNFWSGIHMEKVCSCLCWGGKEDKLKAGFLVLSELWAVLQITWASLDRLWKMVAIVIPCEELNVKWVSGGWNNQGLGFMD